MKKHITIATLLVAGAAFANAEAITWTGTAGDNLFETAGNWSENAVPEMGQTVVIGNSASVIQNTRMDWWEMDVTIKDGATLTCADSVTKWQNGTITVSGGGQLVIKDKGTDMSVNNAGNLTLNVFSQNGIYIEDHVKIANAGTGTTINFGLDGSMYVNEIWHNDWQANITLQLDNGSGISAPTAYTLVTRKFFTLDHNTGDGVKNLLIESATVVDLNNTNMTVVDTLDALTKDAEGMGKCFFTQDATNGSWSVSFVQAIPEPSAFGLLAGLGALALVGTRRRRK